MRHDHQNDAAACSDYVPLPPYDEAPPIGQKVPGGPKFTLKPHQEIQVQSGESWLLDRIFPPEGVGVLFGKSGAFKSFIAADLALAIATGREWGGRETVKGGAIYIASEGAAGLHKRKVGWELHNGALPAEAGFWLIETAPNMGSASGDLDALKQAINGAGVNPSLVVIDTLSASLGAGDENGSGMQTFVQNAHALARLLNCFVLVVHHVGHSEEGRMRGHSSLHAGVDVALLCERQAGLEALVSLAKAKDESDDLAFTINLLRMVVATDARGRDVATLVVSDAVETNAKPKAKIKTVPPSQRLLRDCIEAALVDAGEAVRPYADGPEVKAVCDSIVRARYYAKIAEQAVEGDDATKLAERKRKNFNNAVASLLKSQVVLAFGQAGRRLLWLK
ncbi:MAG: AAA family ATPase [Hyphomicrobiales bacterium]|nr:AAA family ATPase [Hyphomicrobiales bacterium]MDE2116051.1 AAA family ATPase [Hyphomicrobiales bacterium]